TVANMRMHCTLLMLACGVTTASASEPSVLFGAGTTSCEAFVNVVSDPSAHEFTRIVVSWVQGYFSARNTAGRGRNMLTVGGTLSVNTFQSMACQMMASFGSFLH